MEAKLSKKAQKVQSVLEEMGLPCEVLELPGSTRTAKEAAQAIGCEVAQIVKSLIFKGKESGMPVLVVASGVNRVNEKKLRNLIGEKVVKPDADFVREKTGYAIGGIPPVGHTQKLMTFIDEDLLAYEVIWAAAGTPHAVFKLSPEHLKQMTQGRVVPVK